MITTRSFVTHSRHLGVLHRLVPCFFSVPCPRNARGRGAAPPLRSRCNRPRIFIRQFFLWRARSPRSVHVSVVELFCFCRLRNVPRGDGRFCGTRVEVVVVVEVNSNVYFGLRVTSKLYHVQELGRFRYCGVRMWRAMNDTNRCRFYYISPQNKYLDLIFQTVTIEATSSQCNEEKKTMTTPSIDESF